jgi:hypothetical protein
VQHKRRSLVDAFVYALTYRRQCSNAVLSYIELLMCTLERLAVEY